MLKIENLSYSFPQKDLYNEISFTLEDGQHCAFIGTSGSGKSTLVDMIMDPEKYMFDGILDIDSNCRMGYVSQFSQLDKTENVTVFEYIAQEFNIIQSEIASICSEMETALEIEPLLEKYQEALDAFDTIGGDDFESNIEKKLNLANMNRHKDLKISEISGGEFKLVQVIKEMMASPTLMIMDEPDVFLDFENLISLKNLINDYKGMVLVITHSRYLLNHCFNKIVHLENRELQEFDGRYVDYNLSLLQTKIELQELAIADNEEIARNEVLIDRMRLMATEIDDSSLGKSLNARVKLQERLISRRIKTPFVEIKQPDIKLATNNELEDITALKVEGFNLSFDQVLFEDMGFEIKSKDKVALIGSNGTGKTTLLREIFRNESDEIELDDNIEMAYLSQIQGEILDESNTIVDEFFDAGFKTLTDIRTYLLKYGFDEEFIEQKIESLSGGEKNILQLAKISAGKANMLLLDEPTSHLDTYSQIALEEAIENYNGAILMVSHDYYTIMNCMDYVLIIEDKKIRKMSMRKFRKMIYKNHFNKDYVALERKKKTVETGIAVALRDTDFEKARVLSEELEELVKAI
jgi:ATP-binding cassette subfamily F protein 3